MAGSIVYSGSIVTVTLENSNPEPEPDVSEEDIGTGEDGVVMTEPEETSVSDDDEDIPGVG